MLKKTIKVPIYAKKVYLVVAKNISSACMTMTKEKLYPEDPAACVKKRGKFYIFVSKDSFTAPIVVHECIHAATYILRAAGVKISTKNDEALTYLVEYLMEEVCEIADNKDLWSV